MKVIFSLCIFFFSITYLDVSAQGEIDEQQKILYRNERTIAGYLNTNGFGAGFRYGKNLNAFKKIIYDADLMYVKHPKEYKTSNAFNPAGRSFVYGKLNSFYVVRGGIGMQREAYRKYDKGGIAIRYFYSGGPSLGILKPIYYEYYSNSVEPPERTVGKFPEDERPTIFGRASLLKGIDELSYVPGVSAKVGVSFEFSKYDEVVHALESGAALDVYYKKIPIMTGNTNNFVFLTLYLSYRFGKVIDAKGSSSTNIIDDFVIDAVN